MGEMFSSELNVYSWLKDTVVLWFILRTNGLYHYDKTWLCVDTMSS